MAKNKETKTLGRDRIAFVISPIGEPDSQERKRADLILKFIVRPVVAEMGYKVTRADQISKPGIITSQIINHLLNDALVIADLTGHNPNVFYELAVRHVIQRPTIQMIEKGERIPFDVATQRTIEIDHKDLESADKAKRELQQQVKAVEKDPTLVDSPISAAIDLQSLKESKNPTQTALAEMRTSLSNLGADVREVKRILDSAQLPRRSSISDEAAARWLSSSSGSGGVVFPIPKLDLTQKPLSEKELKDFEKLLQQYGKSATKKRDEREDKKKK